jgi:hypothetical protein
LSFVVIGLIWMGHHEQFSHIARVDYRLIWLNLFFLMTIGLILRDEPRAITAPAGDEPLCRDAGDDVAVVGRHLVVRGAIPRSCPRRAAGRCGATGCSLLLTGAVFAPLHRCRLRLSATAGQWTWLLVLPASHVALCSTIEWRALAP